MEGRDFLPAVLKDTPSNRDYVSIAWGPLVTVIDDDWWCNATIWGEEPLLYRVKDDPNLEHNRASDYPSEVKRLIGLAVKDAGGEIPSYFADFKGKPGCTPYLTRIQQGAEIKEL
jgi:hypothetical protein